MNRIILFSLLIVISSNLNCGWTKFWRETKRVATQTSHFIENKVLEPTAHAIENQVIEPAANGVNDHVIKPFCKSLKDGAGKEAAQQGQKVGAAGVKVVVKMASEYIVKGTNSKKRSASEALAEPLKKRQCTK